MKVYIYSINNNKNNNWIKFERNGFENEIVPNFYFDINEQVQFTVNLLTVVRKYRYGAHL